MCMLPQDCNPRYFTTCMLPPPSPLQSYTAIPKGQLVQDHILIIPIGHYPSLLEAPKVDRALNYNLIQSGVTFPLTLGCLWWNNVIQGSIASLLCKQGQVLRSVWTQLSLTTLTTPGEPYMYMHDIHVHVPYVLGIHVVMCAHVGLYEMDTTLVIHVYDIVCS